MRRKWRDINVTTGRMADKNQHVFAALALHGLGKQANSAVHRLGTEAAESQCPIDFFLNFWSCL